MARYSKVSKHVIHVHVSIGAQNAEHSPEAQVNNNRESQIEQVVHNQQQI